MKKFELTAESKINAFGEKLFRIKALIDFSTIKAGETGGWVEKEENIDQSGDAWVSGNAEVSGDARVFGNAEVSGDARVSGNALVSGNAWVFGNAEVSGDAMVFGNAEVSGDAWVFGNALVYGDARVSGNALVSGNADILQITGLGSVHRTTTVFRTKEKGLRVVCGCFSGDLEQFEEQVKRTRTGKNQEEYLKFAELVKIYFKED